MACFELTERFWYGNMDAPVERRGQYKSIVDLAKGYNLPPYHYTYEQIDKDVIHIRLPITEDDKTSIEWEGGLAIVSNLVSVRNLYPCLVHCFAGQCRAPITAAFMEWWTTRRTKTYAEELLAKMQTLSAQHGIDSKRLYHASLRESMLNFEMSK